MPRYTSAPSQHPVGARAWALRQSDFVVRLLSLATHYNSIGSAGSGLRATHSEPSPGKTSGEICLRRKASKSA